MEEKPFNTLRRVVDTDKAEVVDARSAGGEVIKVPIRNLMQSNTALGELADNLAWFMERVTGRGYEKTEEVYDAGYTVREPGHEAYGLKVTTEENCVVVRRVALLEDETVFARYANYLRTGIFV